VLGGYLLLFPRARVVTLVFIIFFVTIIELPALLFLVIWIGQQFLFGYFDLIGPQEGGGVAYFAHIGGFVFGLLLIRAFASEKRRRRQIDRAGLQ
jgi:rhomboid family protein